MNEWPRECDVPDFYGDMGENQVMVALPYPLRLSWKPAQVVRRMSLHKLCAESAQAAMEQIWYVYGQDVYRLGLDIWGGSLNVRQKRNGTSWSMHSWGIAIDWNPGQNMLKWGKDRAQLAQPEYVPFWEAWEEQGWVSLGRERNYDWMHVQAARF